MTVAERVFVSWPDYREDDPETGARLVAAGHRLILAPKLAARTEDELDSLLGDAAAAIVSTDPFSARVIDAHPALKVIARIGVGTDSIDRAAADRAGVAITITPGLNAETVADHTLGFMLTLIRKLSAHDASVKAGRWARFGDMLPGELHGATVGLVGAGTIGAAVARRLSGFSVRVLFFDPAVSALSGAEKVESLDALLATSDVISLHVPLIPATRHLINARALDLMKPRALLINTARGGLVDEEALYDRLRSGHLGGAGLDVFATEPPDAATLADVPNLLCAAHMGGLSAASIRRMTISATQSVLSVLSGTLPDTVINRDAVVKR